MATMTHYGYTIHGPSPEVSVDLPYRSPSIRREPKLSGDNLRSLYRSSISPTQTSPKSNSESVTIGPTTPILPPTPPHVQDGEVEREEQSPSDVNKARSMLVTPVNQQSPPTPEITPPREQSSRLRPFLGPQPSMTSTRAESFKTAHEDLPSDAESESSLSKAQHGLGFKSSSRIRLPLNEHHQPSPLAQIVGLDGTTDQSGSPSPAEPSINDVGCEPVDNFVNETSDVALHQTDNLQLKASLEKEVVTYRDSNNLNSMSLRERLEESKHAPRSPSVDKFADIIGWNEDVSVRNENRWSAMSASTVEAIVVEKPNFQRKRGTLRHVTKTDSLRAVSSPLPRSNRNSVQTSSESPHRLVHKKGKVTNQNRMSFGSEHSRSMSISSSVPPTKIEVIKVAVIPERLSSLASSDRGKHHSQSTSSVSIPLRSRRGSDGQPVPWQRLRTVSDTGRGRDRYYPPQVGPYVVPPRSSSLSAPTSRETSRANSINSESLRLERKKAEKELRTTLSRMESERLATSLRSLSGDIAFPSPTLEPPSLSQVDVRAHDFASDVEPFPGHIVPGTQEWVNLRPPSILTTPFSAPSFLSASPEISEAKIISLFPHNNHSVQLIEPVPVVELRAVRTLRKQEQLRLQNDSPFRDPRAAPAPPTLHFATSLPQKEKFTQLIDSPPKKDGNKRRRPSVGHQDRADSFAKALIRTVSLKHAQNRKADQDLDSDSNPMWRPQPFWDDIDARKAREEEAQSTERGIVQNSVGIPLQRSIFAGPVGLMHRISNRRRDRKAIAKRSSYTSLQRLKAGRRLYRIPGLGIHLQWTGLKDFQTRITKSRQRREDEKREQRREELRKSIGPNVISTGDSRFPTSTV